MPSRFGRTVRTRLIGTAFGIALVVAPAALANAGAFATDDTQVETTTTVALMMTSGVTDSTFIYDLENEPSQCIGLLPKPDCGKKPQQAGDRGGALQWATFGAILAGVGVIGFVIVRNVIRRDRAIAEDLRAKGL